MSDALIQIVDESDRPLGGATIENAHLQGLWHQIVRITVENSDGKLLLQKRVADMEVYPNCWDNSAAGHVDFGETYDYAAARELAEEVGIRNVVLEYVGSYISDSQHNEQMLRHFIKVYKTRVASNVKLTLQADEVSDVQWLSVDEIKALIKNHPNQVTDGLVDVLSRYY